MMKKITLIIALLILTGCASTPVDRSISKENAYSARHAKVYLIIPQNEVIGHLNEISTQGFGIIGDILNSYENSKAYKFMLQRVKPINNLVSDLDFRHDYLSSLKSSGIFINSSNIEILDKAPGSIEERNKLLKGSNGKPVVFISLTYSFEPAYRMLGIISTVSLWNSKGEGPIHTILTSYQSSQVKRDNSVVLVPNLSDKLIELWASNNAEKYRLIYKEGIVESVALLKSSILNPESNIITAKDKTYRFLDFHGGKAVNGKILHEGYDRSIILGENGRYYSTTTGPIFKNARKSLPKIAKGKSRIYFYRIGDGDDLVLFQPEIRINNNKFGEFLSAVVSYIDLEPGEYIISLAYNLDHAGSSVVKSKIEGVKPVSINIEKDGRSHYVRFDGYRGLFTKKDALKVIKEEVALPEINPLFIEL